MQATLWLDVLHARLAQAELNIRLAQAELNIRLVQAEITWQGATKAE